jgi:hypothetical protein
MWRRPSCSKLSVIVPGSLLLLSLILGFHNVDSLHAADMPKILTIEDFSQGVIGQFPDDWGVWKDRDKNRPNYYTVEEEAGNKFLHADSHDQDIIIGKEFRWKLKDYPILNFRMRVHAFPPRGDEIDGPVDSAAAIYVVFSQNFFGIPKIIKYVWSSTLPVGTIDRRKKFARPWIIVVGSGSEKLGEWITVRRNLIEDFDATFGGKPADRPKSIGIMSDSEATNSASIADYDDIWVERLTDQ